MSINPTESDPSLRHIAMDVPREALPEVLAVLGSVAFKYDIVMHTTGSDAETPSIAIESPERQFNPRVVEWFSDEHTNELVPVITKDNLENLETRDTRGLAERSFNAIRRATSKAPIIHDLRSFTFRLDGEMIGFCAEHFPEMVAYLNRPYGCPKNFGEKSLLFFYLVQENLFLPTEPPQTEMVVK